MALTKASLIDLNANELILDLDADTSITADTDDTIHFKIGGTDRVTIAGSALSPSSSDGSALGTTALEWSDLFLADGAVINFGDDQDVSLTHVADTGLLLSSTDQLQFGDSGTYIHQSADGVLDLVSDTEIEINATTIDMNGALEVSGTISSGGVITGTGFTIGSAVITEAELETLDGVTAGTAIASKVVTTDANIDTTGQRNLTITGELDAATLDISGNADIDGTTNLDVVDIDGATQIDATVTVGVDDTGYDVKFFGATSGAYMLWDESVDDLILAGASRVVVPEGNLVLGSTAVTSTAAELNLLDGVSGLVQADLTKLAAVDSTAAELNLLNGVSGLVQADLTKLAAVDSTATELNLIDGGATVGTTAVADGDGILHNDAGTMKVTSAATFKTYFQEGISQAYDDFTVGDAAVNITTSAGDITIDAQGDDTDIIFKGTDGGADTTFLTIDGSAAGKATFNDGIVATTGVFSGVVDADAGITVDNITINGTEIDLSSGSLTIDSAGDITLDADGGTILFHDGGTHFGEVGNSSSDFVIKSAVSDKDILIKGKDGGSTITALTLDMSEAGAATFNSTLTTAAKGIAEASLPVGSVVQFASDFDGDFINLNSTSWVDTGLSISFTPKFSDSIIAAQAIVNVYNAGAGSTHGSVELRLRKNGALWGQEMILYSGYGGTEALVVGPFPVYYAEAQGNTNAYTYQVQIRNDNTTSSASHNQYNGLSSLYIWEIKA